MANLKLRDIINGYESCEGEEFTGKRFFRREITGSLTVSTAKKRKSKINRFAESFSNLLGYTNIRTYGFLFLTFGLLTILGYFAADFLLILNIPVIKEVSALTIGVITAIISIPMIVFDGPISQVMQEYLITDIIFFDFLCIKRLPPINEEKAPDPLRGIAVGVALGILGLFVPTMYIVGVGLFIVYFYLSFGSPEFSLFSTILILPYLSVEEPEGYGILATLVFITVISFVRKLIYGKRVLNFEQYDMLILVMLAVVLISGIVVQGKDSFGWSAKYILLSLVYILAGNIITNRRLADCAVNAIIFSSVAPVVISIVEFVTRLIERNTANLYYNGISSVYYAREIAAAHFAVSMAMAVAAAIQTKGMVKAGYIAVGAFIFIGLILTFEPFAYIAVLVSVLAYLAIRRGRAANAFLLPLALVPYIIVLFLPSELLHDVFGPATDTLEPGNIKLLWLEALTTIKNNPLFGIGMGSEAFIENMKNELFSTAVGTISNSHNLFLEMAVEAGIASLVAFVLIIVVRIRHRIRYQKYLVKCDVKAISDSSACAIFVMLALGSTVYIWQDLSLYYLFWCVFGVGSATLRIAKQEHDDRAVYSRMMSFHESAGKDIASLDVRVKKGEWKRK